jgi:proteic killer suppression protein
MIKSFKHKGLEKFFLTDSKAGIQPAHANKLRKQLTFLNIAQQPSDMGQAGWGLHPLQGKDERWSVWVNGNWRLTFQFAGVDVEIVDYEDYH